jgi:hypothetical protein
MPVLCRFFGIVILMYYDDHPPPHFHARYGGQKAIVSIETFSVLDGQLAPRVLGLVVEWASLHRQELRDAWALAENHAVLQPIPPLE